MKASYGKSMYGGWYLNEVAGEFGKHFDTLKELREYADENGIELVTRYDND